MPYAGPQAAAQLGLTNAQIPGVQANTQATLAGIPLTQAQTQLAQRQAQLPFGGHFMPGSAGQIQALEGMKQMYGENSPQHKMAQRAYDLQRQRDEALINYQNNIANTMQERNLTQMGKGQLEQSRVAQGLTPAGKQYAPGTAPASPQDLAQQYELKRQKDVSDVKSRERTLFATNMEKTLGFINPDDLTRYSGLKGRAELGKEAANAALGNPSENYMKYTNAIKASQLLAKQIRQFYGESIQPAMAEKLETLTNPNSWQYNPEQAKRIFNQTVKILKQEAETYQTGIKSTKAFQPKSDMEKIFSPQSNTDGLIKA